MKNIIFLALVAPFVLMGCNSNSSGGGGGSSSASLSGLHTSSQSATFVINDENRYLVDDTSLEIAGSALFFGDGFLDGDFDFYSMPSRLVENKSTRRLESRSQARMNFSETEDCDDGGSISVSVSSTGISNEGTMSSSGSVTFEATADNCSEVYFGGYEDIENGTMRITIKWSGFSESAETFDRISMTMEAIDYSLAEYYDDVLEYYVESDGSIAVVMTSSSYSIAFSVVTSNEELDGERIKLQTLSNIGGGTDDTYPTSGEWEARGGSGTKVNYKVQPNGILVTVNDGTTELIEWDDL